MNLEHGENSNEQTAVPSVVITHLYKGLTEYVEEVELNGADDDLVLTV